MAASTITRDSWGDDTGTVSAPNQDGTVINNSALQNNIYARIDQMFSGAGAYVTCTFGNQVAAESFSDAATVTMMRPISFGALADTTVTSLTQFSTAALDAVLIIICQGAGGFHIAGIVHLRGSDHGTFLVADPSSSFSITAGTASKINVYWSAGNARYELENKSTVTLTTRVVYFRSA